MSGISKFVGIPFKEKGRDFDGVDCWGLVYLIYKKLRKIELPTYTKSYTLADKKEIERLVREEESHWQKVENPQIYDVLLFRLGGTESHVGIFLGRHKFIHALEGSNTVIERLDSMIWRNRLVGAYHYVKDLS